MRPLTARLEDGYCSITVANHRLITIIRFVVKSYTHLWKGFANKLHLVLHALKILFLGSVCATHCSKPNRARACMWNKWQARVFASTATLASDCDVTCSDLFSARHQYFSFNVRCGSRSRSTVHVCAVTVGGAQWRRAACMRTLLLRAAATSCMRKARKGEEKGCSQWHTLPRIRKVKPFSSAAAGAAVGTSKLVLA